MPPNSMVSFFHCFFLNFCFKVHHMTASPRRTTIHQMWWATNCHTQHFAPSRCSKVFAELNQKCKKVCIISTSQLSIKALQILTLIYYVPCKRPNLCCMCRGLWCREHEQSLLMPGMAKRRKIETGFCRTPSKSLDLPTCPKCYPNT